MHLLILLSHVMVPSLSNDLSTFFYMISNETVPLIDNLALTSIFLCLCVDAMVAMQHMILARVLLSVETYHRYINLKLFKFFFSDTPSGVSFSLRCLILRASK